MKSILILEDDLETLSVIFRVLSETKIDREGGLLC